ncbi:redoxin family protein [Myxococcota bacterium]|nr:redoxin family protein [Myxococcota bacterium]
MLDQHGKFHQLSWYGDQKAVVIFVQGNGCPIVRNGVHALKALRDEYESRGVVFFMLNPQIQDDRESVLEEAEAFGYDFPVLMDDAQLVAESLGVDRTAEVFVIEPKKGTVLYRGPIDDRLHYESQKPTTKHHYLRDALEAALAGEPIPADVPASPGCIIHFPSQKQHRQNPLSYSKDIAPILQNNCVKCHHDGGIAPWSMSSHEMVRGWSLMMREVLMTRRMPPGQIDPYVGKAIREVNGLSVEEKQKLVHWINAGAQRTEGEGDPLAELTFDDPRYSLGEPDMVFSVPAQSIPATGVIDYRYVPVELDLEEDIWVQAVEFVPGDRQVLHHVIAYLSSPADKTVRGRADGSANASSVGGFAPGRQPDFFRDNSGRLIKKGSNLLLQMHYTTTGRETVDATEVGLYLHDQPPAYIMSGGVAGQRRFLVPPHAKEHELEGEQLIERDAYLYSMTPHMHYRGKYMSYTAVYPDGREEVLLSVPKYEFNWQFSYELEEPLFLPAGSKIVAKGAMDNSERNRFNPDPSKPVHFGLQTKHEMFFGFTTLRYVGDTPESLTAGESVTEDLAADF